MAPRRPRRILHATDFSSASGHAFAEAVTLARGAGARLLVLHVLTPPSPFAAGRPPASWIELEARARLVADRRLTRLVAQAARHGIRARGRLVSGPPAETIARQTRRERADL